MNTISSDLTQESSDPLRFCISENRKEDTIGVKLLLLSIFRHEPDAIVHLFIDDLCPSFKEWAQSFPNVVLENLDINPSLGWNIKSLVLRKLLDDGLESVIWIDSDIIITSSVAKYFRGFGPRDVIVTEEFFRFSNRGAAIRTRAWGLDVGRDFPFTLNNCIMRVTQEHRALLEAWQKLLDREDYRYYQKRPSSERPYYFMGAQDSVAALLASTDFMHLPVHVLRRGKDIAQCFRADGFSPTERLVNIFSGMPPFVHAQGGKPWRSEAAGSVYHYVSPYWYAALSYLDGLSPNEAAWLHHRPIGARILHMISLGHPSMAGFLPALTFQISKYSKTAWRKLTGR